MSPTCGLHTIALPSSGHLPVSQIHLQGASGITVTRTFRGDPLMSGAPLAAHSGLQQGNLVFWNRVFTAIVGLGPLVLLQVFRRKHKVFKH